MTFIGNVFNRVFRGKPAGKAVEELAPKITNIEQHPNYGLFQQRLDEYLSLGEQQKDLVYYEAVFANGKVPLSSSKTKELQNSGHFTQEGLGVGNWEHFRTNNDHDNALASTQEALAPQKMTHAQMKMLLKQQPSGLKSYVHLEHRNALADQANEILEDSKLQRAEINQKMNGKNGIAESNKSLREGMENDIQQWNTPSVAPPKKGIWAGIKSLFGFN
ncbi:MAG: hypothetical protein ACK5T0_09720 [Vampirovibrionales bacterium]